MVPEAELKADKQAIAAFLAEVVSGWDELPEPAVVELRCLFPEKTPNICRFNPTPTGLQDLADHAVEMNKYGLNCYIVVNPVRAGTRNRSATDADIIASHYFWADGDDEEAANSIRNFAGPRWTMAVTTGRIPSPRPHIYWRTDEWVFNLAAWTGIQKAIAARLSTDPTVVNPSRIMRLPGTINWPTDKKAAKGRVAELTTLRTDYEDDRDPVSFEQMLRAFGSGPSLAQQAQSAAGLAIDTGPQAMDREAARIKALSGEQWHAEVVRLVASYVSRGLRDDEIHALTDPLTLPGYTVDQTRREVQTAIDGARRKGWAPQDEQFREMTPEEKEAVPALMFKPWGHRDLTAIPHPVFVYSDFYARGYTSVTLAPPKVGKSMLGLAEALDMASGRGFLTGAPREKLRVVYYNAEDDQSVIDSRVAALLTAYGIPQEEIAETLFPVSGVERDDFFMVSGQEGVINETLFVGLEKFIREQHADVLIFDPLQDLSRSPETNEVFRLLGQRLRRMANATGVALGLIHHTRKIAPGSTPTIDDGRGGSALRGTARFNRLLIGMSEDEGVKAGVQNHRHYMRIGDMESNLAPPSADVNRWFEKVSVLTPNGHEVGAIKPWQWPDAFMGLRREDAAAVRSAIAACDPAPRESAKSKDWAGYVVADVLGLDGDDKADKARIMSLLKEWIKSGVLGLETVRDNRAGRDVKVVVAGDNSPMSEVNQ
ncbi:AAA family ATPase [Paracoccus sp. 22332]|uniref:AAA family ATPase n=1 Tax=Paracoccus sp. 22332 TaxID=3453913 RepID=UPI003F82714F